MTSKIDRDKLTALAVIEIIVHPEDTHPRDHFAYDDPEDTARAVAEICCEAEWNEWAWCCVQVRATYAGISESAYLGGCSYRSEDDFRACDYFADMRGEVIDQLACALELASERITEVV